MIPMDLSPVRRLAAALIIVATSTPSGRSAEATASSSQPGAPATGAVDGDRFAADSSHAWKGDQAAETWWWQCQWTEPRPVGAILQIVGDDSPRLQNAPRSTRWQTSLDGAPMDRASRNVGRR